RRRHLVGDEPLCGPAASVAKLHELRALALRDQRAGRVGDGPRRCWRHRPGPHGVHSQVLLLGRLAPPLPHPYADRDHRRSDGSAPSLSAVAAGGAVMTSTDATVARARIPFDRGIALRHPAVFQRRLSALLLRLALFAGFGGLFVYAIFRLDLSV